MKGLKKILVAGLVAFGAITAYGVSANAANEYFNEKYYDTTIPAGYYDGIDTSLTGDAFKNVLGPIISKNYHQHSYKENNTVLKYTDPDPKHPRKVIGFYSGQSLSEGAWNKEHVWAKSHGFPNSGAAPYCDAHHLRPTINKINSDRGNLDFGELPGVSADQYGNKKGDVFEPRDEVKGDVARIMFYMETRYKKDYNLKLVNDRKTSLSDTNGRFGGLQTLIKWHYQDPVSKEEVYRNNVIYDKFQHNRNPYIDHPEWVKLAYPNDYDGGEINPNPNPGDSEAIKEVIDLINKIPTMPTLDDKDTITLAKAKYEALASADKSSVTNYTKLNEALKVINSLEHPNVSGGDTDKPVNKDDILIDFTNSQIHGMGYSKNVDFTVNNLDFLASDFYVAGSDVRLGHNKSGSSLAKFGIDNTGAYLEPKFDTEGLKSFNLTLGQIYGSADIAWQVLFKESGSEAYTKVNEGTVGTDKLEINASLASPKNGKFILVILGSKSRIQLGSYHLTVEKGSVTPTPNPGVSAKDSFVLEETKSSLRVSFNDTEVDADLRFGTRIKAESFNSNAKYGVLVVEGNRELTSGLQEATTISAYSKNKFLEMTPVRVDENGNEAEDGNFYQFAWVITNMEGHYDFLFNAVIYMELDGKLYFGNPIKASLNDTTKFYLDNNLVEDPVVRKVLEDLLK